MAQAGMVQIGIEEFLDQNQFSDLDSFLELEWKKTPEADKPKDHADKMVWGFEIIQKHNLKIVNDDSKRYPGDIWQHISAYVAHAHNVR